MTLAVTAGCCPRPAPGDARYAAAPTVPSSQTAAQRPRDVPAPVVGRSREPTGQAEPVEREMITEPPAGLPGPKLDEATLAREPLAPPAPAPPLDTLPDEIVMRLLEAHRAAFVRCFKKAVEVDPTQRSFKVRVHVELDGEAAITRVRTDATNATLDACLVRAVAWLKFPATGARVAVELPMFFRAE